MRTNHAIVSLFLMALASIIFVISIPPAVHAPSSGFIFDAAGDFGYQSGTKTVMQGMGASHANFALTLGDLLYNNPLTSSPSEQVWCQQFKNNITNVEVVVGNHDTFQTNGTQGGGSINKFIQYCPFTLGVLGGGAYGFQYYFDYPQPNPLARFILVQPNIWNGTGSSSAVSYDSSTPAGRQQQAWVNSTIDNARNSGIPWI